MGLKTILHIGSEWVKTVADAVKGSAQVALESSLLKDTVKDFAEIGGVMGAVFKLGAMVLPEPTPEQKIALTLHNTFLKTLDAFLIKHDEIIPLGVWRRYLREKGDAVATKHLEREFTWLALFGPRGAVSSRSWPLALALADLGRAWVAGAAMLAGKSASEASSTADTIRGHLADDLARAVEKLMQDAEMQKAWREAVAGAGRKSLELLADDLSILDQFPLFHEIPQNLVYIPPTVKRIDFAAEPSVELKWDKIKPEASLAFLTDCLCDGQPRIVVIVGDMGVGKSCLMRTLAAHLASRYRVARDRATVFVRWRDIWRQSDLLSAVAKRIGEDSGLPLNDLPQQDRVVYFVDGFDEMTSHDPGVVHSLFERVARIVSGNPFRTVVLAMRSSVVTAGVEEAWKEAKALVCQVQAFTDDRVDRWADRWRAVTGNDDLTGKKLRDVADTDVTHNPLLLYMLVRYVVPQAKEGRKLGQTDVFRTFVDETIQGKIRSSGERYPFPPEFASKYRLLLQEMAFVASWPKSNGNCSERELRTWLDGEFGRDVLKELHFNDIRTAFVLHFFNPGDFRHGEFEFLPEGFRQYLLAEWCVRVQLDALHDDGDECRGPFRRKRSEAMNALAQLPLREVERDMLDELFTNLGRLCSTPKILSDRLKAFGFEVSDPNDSPRLISKLERRVRGHGETPPAHSWKDEKIGVPEGQEVCAALSSLRLLVNYWDQCLIAAFALCRGLGKRNESREVKDCYWLLRFFHARDVVRWPLWGPGFNLSSLQLSFLNLNRAPLGGADLQGTILKNARMQGADMEHADLEGADLQGANLEGANLRVATLYDTNLRGADLLGANLQWAHSRHVNFCNANLRDANLQRASLPEANLFEANLQAANLQGADMQGANLSQAKLKEANLQMADLRAADLQAADLQAADLRGADLRKANFRKANLQNADLRGADLREADLREADLRDADLRDCSRVGAHWDGALLYGALQ